MKPDDVFERVRQGPDLSQLTKQIPWKTFSLKIWEEMRQKACSLEERSLGLSTLRFLLQVSQDDWFSIRVLFNACDFPTLPHDQRPKVLATIRRRLDRLWIEIIEGKAPGDHIKNFFVFDAYYHVLSGKIAENSKHLELASQEYVLALELYKKSRDLSKVAYLEDRLRSIQQDREGAKPGTVEARRQALEQEITQLAKQVSDEKQLLEQVQANKLLRQSDLISARQSLSQINAEIQENFLKRDNLQQLIQQLQTEYAHKLAELEKLKADIAKTASAPVSLAITDSGKDYQNLKKQYEEALARIAQLEQKQPRSAERVLPGFVDPSVIRKR